MPGLRGLVAQGMNGRKGNLPASPIPQMLDVSTGSGTFTALFSGILSIYVFGAGSSGIASNGASRQGGNGGGAVFKRIRVSPTQSLTWAVGVGGAGQASGSGNVGTASTVTLPNGSTLTATGADVAGGLGGTGSGGDANGTGGLGTQSATGATGGNGGGVGSTGDGINTGGGGGCGGLASVTAGLFPPISATIGQGGLGNGINGGTGAGGNGRVLMILERYAARP